MKIEIDEQKNPPSKQEWWIKGLVPKRRLVLLSAQGGTGKTAVAQYISKTLTQRGVRILYWSFEEDGDDFTNKLGGKVTGLDVAVRENTEVDFSSEYEVMEFNNYLYENGYDILIIDPIAALLDGDSNDNQKVRKLLNALSLLSKNAGVTIIGIHHFRKPGRGGIENIRGAVIGASAWVDTARLVLCLVKDKIGGNMYLETVKSNISKTGESWAVEHHIDEYRGLLVDNIVPAGEGMGQRVLDSPDKEVVPPVIERLKENFAIGAMFTLDDVKEAGATSSFYHWLSKHPSEFQICKKKKDGKKAYIFI